MPTEETLAKDLLPVSGAPDWVWRAKDITKGGFERLYVASRINDGWKYYTTEGPIRLSKTFPADYEKDIGYRFGHGPGKTDKNGNALLERAKPSGVYIFRAWHVEKQRYVCATIDSYPLQERIHQLFQNPEYKLLASGISNFYLTIYNNSNPSSKALTYTADAALRPLGNPDALAHAGDAFYPDQFWLGMNPFEAPATPPENAGQPTGASTTGASTTGAGTNGTAAPAPAVVQDRNGSEVNTQVSADNDIVW